MDEPKPMRELTRIREERGLSQQGLADASGVNKATINQIERGRRSPNLETLQKLADALAVELGDFFPKIEPRLPMPLDGLVSGAGADEERRKERRAASAAEAIKEARRFMDLHEDIHAVRDHLDKHREEWEKRLAEGDFDKAAIEEAGHSLGAFWVAVTATANSELAALQRIGTPPEELAARSELLPAIDRFQVLCHTVNTIYREKYEGKVFAFPEREAS